MAVGIGVFIYCKHEKYLYGAYEKTRCSWMKGVLYCNYEKADGRTHFICFLYWGFVEHRGCAGTFREDCGKQGGRTYTRHFKLSRRF